MRTTRASLLIVLVASLIAAGCGRGSDDPVGATARALRGVRSGDLDLRFTATPEGGGDVGFRMSGPFAIPEREGELAAARLTYTRLLGDRQEQRTFISTGNKAYVQADGQTWQLPDAAVADLRAGDDAGEDALGGLHFEDWVGDAQVKDEGDGTRRVTADVDPVKALNDLSALARSMGGEGAPRPLTGGDAETLRRAVRSARMTLISGKDDHMLRSLEVTFVFGVRASKAVESVLGDLAGVKMVLALELAKPNQPVRIEPPAQAQPLPG